MKIRFRKGQELSKRAGIFHNPQNLTRGTVPTKAPPAPLALPAGQIDFSDYPPAEESRIIRSDHFANEFMPRRALKCIVTAEKFDVCVANAGTQETNQRVAGGPLRSWNLADTSPSILKMNSDHAGLAYHLRFIIVRESIK